MFRALGIILLTLLVSALAGCSGDRGSRTDAPAATVPSTQRFPDVLEAELEPAGGGRFDVRVTVFSPYDTPERYADGWRVLAPDDTVLGEHTLLHDHAGEQPFTRVQPGVEIPAEVDHVTVEARDLVNGFGGGTVTVPVPVPR